MKKEKLLLCVYSFALVQCVAVCAATPMYGLNENKIVAVVNDESITQRDLEDFTRFMQVRMSTEYSPQDLELKMQSMKSDLLNKLIEDRLILQEARKEKVVVDINRVKAKIDEMRQHYDSTIEFQDALRKQGLVQSDLESRIKDQLLMFSVVDLKIKRTIVVKPGEVTAYYQKNTKEFLIPELREFSSCAADTEESAQGVQEDLGKGRSLEDVAVSRKLSLNKMSVSRGEQLKSDIEEVVYGLALGQVSAPFKTGNKYYIFRLDHITPARQQSLSEVQNQINGLLFNKKMTEGLVKWLDELKKKSYVKVMEESDQRGK